MKYLISCSLPSSSRRKSPFSKPPINALFFPRTVHRTLTRSTSTLIVLSWGKARERQQHSQRGDTQRETAHTYTVRLPRARWGFMRLLK